MRLVSFSVENYRSITTARKIPLSDYSLLIGANNEEKSNILHALRLAMDALVGWRYQLRRTPDGRVIRGPGYPYRYRWDGYEWETDFPIIKQKGTKGPHGATNITLEFLLDAGEVAEFKEDIKSSLNGTLPIQVSFSKNGIDISVQKPGRGHVTLNKKSKRIAEFISKRIRFEYIPAIRTASSANQIITELVESELRILEENSEYAEAIQKIEEDSKTDIYQLSKTIQETVSGFLPSVKSVRLDPKREARYRALRREVEIMVDDGQETRLARKGDGVQSLVALALMRHASEQVGFHASTVIAIEEPESYLHPRAIHELRSVIEDLSSANQIVISSHSPLFVNRTEIKSNIIVSGSKAKCADQISEVRETLGVRFADNLQNASVVLLVEGREDTQALKPIIALRSAQLRQALASGTATFDLLGGASALSHKASFYTAGACQVQCFMDNDIEAKNAVEKALAAKTLRLAHVNHCSVPSMVESELEDLYNAAVYKSDFIAEFGVDPSIRVKGKVKKWSLQMQARFLSAGKPWNEGIKGEIKWWLSDFASQHPDVIVREELSAPLESFIRSAEAKLPKSE